ncbi:hypothetical protein [Streptomyces sp. NPDC021356]|uniref:hypothetical protein n=1 Tax=Streptomyces sp. NPDC021356 TaxID=3154900 RepID=UPI0033EB7FE6
MHALDDPPPAALARRGALVLNARLGKSHPKAEDAFALANRQLVDGSCDGHGEVVAAVEAYGTEPAPVTGSRPSRTPRAV